MSDRELGGLGSDVIFENDIVKVWRNDLEPRESSDWHHHTNHYLFVATTYRDLRVEHDDGTAQGNVMEVGRVVMGQKDSIRQLSNVGSNSYSSVIIEIQR